MKLKMILNKANKSATIQLPKKSFDKVSRDKISKSRWAFIKFEGFE
jgi:hypothetical protein